MNIHHERARELVHELVSEWISRESSRSSLITVTRVGLNDKETYADIIISVFPETQEQAVLDFLSRNGSEAREFVRERSRLRTIPRFRFIIDEGEKKRREFEKLFDEQQKQ